MTITKRNNRTLILTQMCHGPHLDAVDDTTPEMGQYIASPS